MNCLAILLWIPAAASFAQEVLPPVVAVHIGKGPNLARFRKEMADQPGCLVILPGDDPRWAVRMEDQWERLQLLSALAERRMNPLLAEGKPDDLKRPLTEEEDRRIFGPHARAMERGRHSLNPVEVCLSFPAAIMGPGDCS